MPHRSPARFLAPLALLAAVATIYLVAQPELRGSSEGSRTTARATETTRSTSASTAKRSKSAARKRKPRTYTVKPGDNLGSIAESTEVTVADLLDYNDLDDPQSLRVGQKLKLTR